jgi:cholesterol oxidase
MKMMVDGVISSIPAAEHFDAIVVGSGFGGAVTAARLSEAGKRVCVLERGKAYPPGSFPRSPLGLKHNLWDPSAGLLGMFDFWSFSGLDALVSSGLGGGSLIYANVLIRKDEKWFAHEDPNVPGQEYWPISRADLDPHYDRVEAGLDGQRFPLDHAPYDQTAKTLAFRDAATAIGRGDDWFLPKLAVTFANPGQPPVPGVPIIEAQPNLHGLPRETCRLCGECDVGCNYGAKNTLDYTYLTRAWHAGADIRTLCEVRSFEPREGGGWTVNYVHHDEHADGPTDTRSLPQVTLTADDLILSAGTLGSTFLLLRNRGALPGLSPTLGRGFSGNGDLLTFAARARQEQNGKRVPRVTDAAHGPVITSAIRTADALDGDGHTGRGFYLEDAGYPAFVSWMLQMADLPGEAFEALRVGERMVKGFMHHDRQTDITGDVSDFLGACGLSSGTLPLLGMGRDVPDGVMTLAGELLEVNWSKHGASKTYFDRVRELSEEISHALGADFLDNPIWLLNRVITVHSLGGCRIGRNDQEGVVDPYGRVFNLPGLHVADGSVMPGPVGANPSLTIAALADRFADAMLEGAPDPTVRRAGPTTPEGSPPAEDERAGVGAVSVGFTETMKGFVAFGDESDFDAGYREGRKAGTALNFTLTITAKDIDRFVIDSAHQAEAVGHVDCDALGGKCPVERGIFNLFVDQDGDKANKRMFYRLYFTDGAGHPLTLVGHKIVVNDGRTEVWHDTSTLYTRVLTGHVPEAEDEQASVLAAGVLHIHPLDFAHQLTTFRVHPAERVDALARFGALFAGDLWDAYGPGTHARPAETAE